MKTSVKVFRALSALLLLAFSVYALLDTFLIPRVYASQESPAVAATEESSIAQPLSAVAGKENTAQITENSYSDDSLSVEISSYRVEDTTVYVADIRIEDPESLRAAFSQNSYGRNITAVSSETAESVGAVLEVNGDNYGSREKGYVIRNGVLYRELAASDTLYLARRTWKLPCYKLAFLAEWFDIEMPRAHRAWCDAETAARLYLMMRG